LGLWQRGRQQRCGRAYPQDTNKDCGIYRPGIYWNSLGVRI